jgi:hypothetical protein
MQKLNPMFRAIAVLCLAASSCAVSLAQQRSLQIDDFYGDVKQVLTSHYTGKTTKTKLPIPATRRGLEMIDGSIQTRAEKEPPPVAAIIGDELTIKSFRVGDSNIEVLFAKAEPPLKRRVPNPFSAWRQPRINLRFTRELNVKDLTIENINRLLAPAVDVSTLGPPAAETLAQATQAALAAAPPTSPATMTEPQIVGELPAVGLGVAELVVECSVKDARVYIDGAYSGFAPRTLRLRAGVHTILVIRDGYSSWEQRMLLPGAKVSLVRAELRK